MTTRRQYLNNHKRVKKGAKAKGPSENEIHMKCAKWVRDTYPNLLIFHVANERKAAPQYHQKLKRLGVLAGVADFLAFPRNGRKFAIELKNEEGSQSIDQVKFERRWVRTGGAYIAVHSLADFQSFIGVMVLFND